MNESEDILQIREWLETQPFASLESIAFDRKSMEMSA